MPDWVLVVFGTLAMTVFGGVVGLFMMGVDRILAARMQARVGPPLQQPFLDIAKLMAKENIVPGQALPWLFNGAPLLAVAASIALLLYVPVAGFGPILSAHGDLVLVLYLLAMPGLALVIGGLASSSPYATIGAQRELITMAAYELPLASTAVAFAWRLSAAGVAEPFSLAALVAHPIWGLVGPVGFAGALLLLFVMVLVTPGELSRIPFDTPEAETELAGGLLVEYSGRNLALFHLSFGVKTVAMCALMVALFFPYNLSDALSLGQATAAVADVLFFVFKLLVVMFVCVSLVRVAVARFRITQVVTLYWKGLGTAGLLGLVLLMVDVILSQ